MPEYIEREAVLQALQCCFIRKPEPDDIVSVTLELARKKVSKIPAADVEPVRHGKWVHTNMAAHWRGKDQCGRCGFHERNRQDLSHYQYCPNCGAKMDLEEVAKTSF